MVITVRSYTPGKVGEDEGFNAQENLPEQQIDAVEKIQEIEKKNQDSLKIDEGQDIKPVTSVVEGEYFTTRKSLMENQQFMNSARDFLQDKIAAYKIPSMIKIHFEELPRVASGKFSKKQLRDEFVAIEQHTS
mgnify:CR=1 FL=1